MDPMTFALKHPLWTAFALLLVFGCSGPSVPTPAPGSPERDLPSRSFSGDDEPSRDAGAPSFGSDSSAFSDLLNLIFRQLAAREHRFDEGPRQGGIPIRGDGPSLSPDSSPGSESPERSASVTLLEGCRR